MKKLICTANNGFTVGSSRELNFNPYFQEDSLHHGNLLRSSFCVCAYFFPEIHDSPLSLDRMIRHVSSKSPIIRHVSHSNLPYEEGHTFSIPLVFGYPMISISNFQHVNGTSRDEVIPMELNPDGLAIPNLSYPTRLYTQPSISQ